MSTKIREVSASGNRKGQRAILAGLFVLALLVLVSAGVVLRQPLLEKWYVHLLRKGQPDEQMDAVRQLASLGAFGAAGDVWQAILEHANLSRALDDPWAASMRDAGAAFGRSILPFVLDGVKSEQEVISKYACDFVLKMTSQGHAESELQIELELSDLRSDEQYDKAVRNSAGDALNALRFRKIQKGLYNDKQLSAMVRDLAASIKVREAAKAERSWGQGMGDAAPEYWTQDQLARWQQLKERMPARRKSLGIPDDWVDVLPAAAFGFCLPPEFTPVDVVGIDSFIGQYQGRNISVHFDCGRFSNTLEQ